jgi:hypothetical protein
VIERIGGPRRVGETLVLGVSRHVAAAEDHSTELSSRLDGEGGRHTRLDHNPLEKPTEGGSDLPACQTDESVGAENGWVFTIEDARRLFLRIRLLRHDHGRTPRVRTFLLVLGRR